MVQCGDIEPYFFGQKLLYLVKRIHARLSIILCNILEMHGRSEIDVKLFKY